MNISIYNALYYLRTCNIYAFLTHAIGDNSLSVSREIETMIRFLSPAYRYRLRYTYTYFWYRLQFCSRTSTAPRKTLTPLTTVVVLLGSSVCVRRVR
jgi:hypothetical protein